LKVPVEDITGMVPIRVSATTTTTSEFTATLLQFAANIILFYFYCTMKNKQGWRLNYFLYLENGGSFLLKLINDSAPVIFRLRRKN
jgi:hypothetical protein